MKAPIDGEITSPRREGSRSKWPAERLTAEFTDDSDMALTTADLPTKVECDPIVGEGAIHTLDDLKARREQEVVFVIARRILEQYFRDEDGNPKMWIFPDLVTITRDWISQCLKLKDNTFHQLLLLAENSHNAATKVYQAIVTA